MVLRHAADALEAKDRKIKRLTTALAAMNAIAKGRLEEIERLTQIADDRWAKSVHDEAEIERLSTDLEVIRKTNEMLRRELALAIAEPETLP